ncbi:EutN/CcmL family microcompartment protein [Alkaliphilus crotonatoxidans]
MFIGKVVGTIVSTSKVNSLVGKKILIVQPQTAQGKPCGQPVVSIDAIGSGFGERVLVTTGSGAREAFNEAQAIDSAIVAIIDSIEIDLEVEEDDTI